MICKLEQLRYHLQFIVSQSKKLKIGFCDMRNLRLKTIAFYEFMRWRKCFAYRHNYEEESLPMLNTTNNTEEQTALIN